MVMKKHSYIFCAYAWILIFLNSLPVCSAEQKVATYRLGIEDVINFSIFAGGIEQVNQNLVVNENGNITFPFIGKVKAQGLTLNELEKKVSLPLQKNYFVDPQINLRIKEYHSLEFFISGAVKNAGLYELNFTPTIMDLLAKAGGVEPNRGDIAYILRGVNLKNKSKETFEQNIKNSNPIMVDLIKLLEQGDMTENITLVSGDTIYIPLGKKLDQTRTKVYVEGRIKNPGVFDYYPGMTAFSACIMAGGFSKFAAPGRTKIIRKTQEGQEIINIDLDDVQTGKKPDLPLKPGDRIHVPESWL